MSFGSVARKVWAVVVKAVGGSSSESNTATTNAATGVRGMLPPNLIQKAGDKLKEKLQNPKSGSQA